MKNYALIQHKGTNLRVVMTLILAFTLALALLGGQRAQAAPQMQADPATDPSEWTGLVESMPASGTEGTWTIGGRAFVVDANTVIDETTQPLAVGVCAEVYYETTATGDVASELEATDDTDCTDEDGDQDECDDMEDPDTGNNDDDTSDTEPDQTEDPADGDTTGDMTDDTEDTDGDTTEDDCGDGEDDDGDDDANENEVYGTIEVMPSGTLTGTWVIDGVDYVATEMTEFEEEQGSFAVGALVELEFTVVNGVNQLEELETHREPGTGSTTRTGLIQTQGTAIVAANVNANGTWQVGDVAYTVLPITELSEDSGALVIGAMAEVNSYTAANGSEIATRIRSIGSNQTVATMIYLPTVWR